MNPLNFTALDFETATPDHNSICQVGIVVVRNGIITKKYSSLVKPPNNEFAYHNIKVHGIEPYMTENAPSFYEAWSEFSKFIIDQHLVCHNASFDLVKLESSLNHYMIPVPNYSYSCTFEIFGGSLPQCCLESEIEFSNHHDALSDAEACAKLYLKFLESKGEIIIQNPDYLPFSIKKVDKIDLIPDFEHANVNSHFYRKKVVFTGDLRNFTRREAAHLIKDLGADVNTSISKNTDFVIVGNNPGPSKMEKIAVLGVPIISEDDFLKMLE
jgi:DNA polymerase III subunit epsilon